MGLVGAGFLAFVGVFLYATFRFDPTRAGAWFAGLSAIVAGLALMAALGAAWLALPGYLEWEREQARSPELRIHIEVGPANDPDPTRSQILQEVSRETDEITVACRGQAEVYVRVAIFNDGDGSLRNGVLNVCVPEQSDLETLDPPVTSHRRIPFTALNGSIEPGRVVRVRASVVETDFAPGLRMFHLRVWLPLGESTPVLVVVAGDPPPISTRRIMITPTVEV